MKVRREHFNGRKLVLKKGDPLGKNPYATGVVGYCLFAKDWHSTYRKGTEKYAEHKGNLGAREGWYVKEEVMQLELFPQTADKAKDDTEGTADNK